MLRETAGVINIRAISVTCAPSAGAEIKETSTEDGHRCQRWDSQVPNTHPYNPGPY